MEPDRRRVLVLAYYFPPVGGAGVQRTLKFVKHLAAARLGRDGRLHPLAGLRRARRVAAGRGAGDDRRDPDDGPAARALPRVRAPPPAPAEAARVRAVAGRRARLDAVRVLRRVARRSPRPPRSGLLDLRSVWEPSRCPARVAADAASRGWPTSGTSGRRTRTSPGSRASSRGCPSARSAQSPAARANVVVAAYYFRLAGLRGRRPANGSRSSTASTRPTCPQRTRRARPLTASCSRTSGRSTTSRIRAPPCGRSPRSPRAARSTASQVEVRLVGNVWIPGFAPRRGPSRATGYVEHARAIAEMHAATALLLYVPRPRASRPRGSCSSTSRRAGRFSASRDRTTSRAGS